MTELERRLRAGGGVVNRRVHRDISGHIDRMLRTGRLVALLPGVYCAVADADSVGVRLRAAASWAGRDSVLMGYSAARLSFWPSCPVPTVTLATPSQSKRSRAGFDVECRRLSPWLTHFRDGMTISSPALTAVDLAAGPEGGDVIDRVLRSRQASLAQMWEVLASQPHRRGNELRAALLWDSRDEPWSEAERLNHRLLRAAGIEGWETNRWVSVPGGGYFVDVLFKRQRVVLEVDGWEIHGTREAFETDRQRRNHLVLAGYTVLNFTWRQLVENPEWVIQCIKAALGTPAGALTDLFSLAARPSAEAPLAAIRPSGRGM